ncbi:MAG TPA: aminomethyltransferase family protein [Roseiarcus sp.]|nr:aminomethyltransferase family protein [Roseiarcus sp.]
MIRKHTPYFHQFLSLGAEMVDRIGFDAAFKFTSIENEHLATRNRAGLYDVYYQVLVDVRGADAEKLLQRALVNDVARMVDGKVLYSSLCNDAGGMIDDLTCFRLTSSHFWLCPTPSRVDRITAYLTELASGLNAYITNLGAGRAFLSVQGPLSRQILAPLADVDISSAAALPYYSFTRGTVAGVPDVVISRTGYSGELGFELFYPGEYAHHMYAALLAAGRPHGMEPCGLGALRSVRIEKRYPLYGLDLDETTSPIEAGLGWTVRLNKGSFIGYDALARQTHEGVSRRLALVVFPDLAFVPAPGNAIAFDGKTVGKVTSADRGYFLGKSLALGYLPPDIETGAQVTISDGSGAKAQGEVRLKAPHDPEMTRAKA